MVSLQLVREVGGRLNFHGDELRPLDEASVREAARYLSRSTASSAIGVCLIHAYASSAHERRGGRDRRRGVPGGHAVAPPARCCRNTANTNVPSPLWSMPSSSRIWNATSSACVTSCGLAERQAVPGDAVERRASRATEQVVRKPITTALSGPAAGALGSAVIAEIAGFPEPGDARCRRHRPPISA